MLWLYYPTAKVIRPETIKPHPLMMGKNSKDEAIIGGISGDKYLLHLRFLNFSPVSEPSPRAISSSSSTMMLPLFSLVKMDVEKNFYI